ncbi:hypothetical protein A2866_03780 [Candidatus Roizmanbacteria bacterium RIFCSPHIGHO2_01_FULL_39_8]|uniref:Bacterial Ig domain-containing protein n=2 Tax=Candidatus Roizmaniibacteriota TaxID=1752723 RepID=A0A1F7GID9_9BACT|nr:MAG: hypothetical protein A2866_03780 [Candidatus Roizmanbacteria bacterium RIFCSPHIGHO2_01_FULL_39_8]OGK28235.1 MAG: hypothetical protein A3C28_05210 [Candidatus Roizmanbacteria bacterium RIFCSPHIGHO2_02_FULL_39_9]
MGRLDRYQKKQQKRQIFFAVGVLIVVVILLFSYGIPLILNTSLFIAHLTEPKVTPSELEKNENFFGNVDISSIPSATNSAKIEVGGSAVNFTDLEFYLNDDLAKEVNLSTSGNFIEEIENLKEGLNTLYVIAKAKHSSEEKKTEEFEIYYKNTKPKLDIKNPQDGSKTNQTEVSVSGSTDKETYIKVNGLPVVVDAQGNFQTSIRLKEGENQIQISAQDVAGNTEEKMLKVIYEKD